MASEPTKLSPLACDIIAAIAVEPTFATRLALMLGYHPDEQRHLTEMEERAGRLYGRLSVSTALYGQDEFSRALALWREHWGDWCLSEAALRSETAYIEEHWRSLLPSCKALGAAYLFSRVGAIPVEMRDGCDEAYRETFDLVQGAARAHPLAGTQTTWVTSFFSGGRFRGVFEELCGLSGAVKGRLGLDDESSGLLLRYAVAHAVPLDELLNPRQFEHLVADVYRAEGWQCRVTRYSKDGGVDIEASRMIDGAPVVALIQAKRNRSKSRGQSARPVGIDDVKAFAATVRGEGRDAGVVVTSSSFTKDALAWAATKGRRVATLQFLDGEGLRERLYQVGRGARPGEVRAYFVHAGI